MTVNLVQFFPNMIIKKGLSKGDGGRICSPCLDSLYVGDNLMLPSPNDLLTQLWRCLITFCQVSLKKLVWIGPSSLEDVIIIYVDFNAYMSVTLVTTSSILNPTFSATRYLLFVISLCRLSSSTSSLEDNHCHSQLPRKLLCWCCDVVTWLHATTITMSMLWIRLHVSIIVSLHG